MHRGQQRTTALPLRSFAPMPLASPGGWMVWVRCPTRRDAPRATRRPQGSAIVSKLSLRDDFVWTQQEGTDNRCFLKNPALPLAHSCRQSASMRA